MMTLRRPPRRGFGEQPATLAAIQNLFARGELGGYWPADPAYAYEDTAKTIPGSINGVVGLRLDISKNALLGPELIIDPNFTYGLTYWNVINTDATHTITPESGGVRYLSDTTSPVLYLTYNSMPAGLLQITINTSVVSGRIKDDGGNDIGNGQTVFCKYDTVLQGINFYRSVLNVNILIKSISIKLIYGNHAIQATTANKPYLRRTPATGKTWYDSNTATGALTATFSGSLGSSCTIATVTPEGVSILENQTVGTTYNICPPYGYNSDVLIINRALTPAEKALVTRVMQRNVPTLGSNLIIDPDFDSPALWTTDGNAAVSGGCATFTNAVIGDGTYVRSTNDYSFSTDIFYWIKIKNSSYSSGQLFLARYGLEGIGGFSLINDNFMAKKMNSIIGSKLQLYQVYNGSNLTVSVDSLSIKGIF